MKITSIGEILVDMTQTHVDENGIPHFAANPGGAPANVAVAAKKLGVETGFIGCVGDDAYGRLLRDTLVRFGVSIVGMGPIGAGIYAMLNRALIPIGLHHALNAVFWFDTAGINDLGNFWAGTGTLGTTGMYMASI